MGWGAGRHPPTIPIPSLGIPVTPSTQGHLPSPALCPLALLSLPPCCLLPGVLPSLVPFLAAPLTPLLSLAHLVHCACSCCFLLSLHPCPVLLLPVRFTGPHSLALPPAGRGALPLLRCSAKPALPLSAVCHWVGCCAPLLSPPAHPGARTFRPLNPSQAGRWSQAQTSGPGGDGAGAPCAPAPRTEPSAGGTPRSPPPPAPPC